MNDIFSEIRPFRPEELQDVYTQLFAEQGFHHVLNFLYPNIGHADIEKRMRLCATSLEFQRNFCVEFLDGVLARSGKGIEMDSSSIDLSKRYTFMSNHRDIVLDSAFLSYLLLKNGCDTTTEIGIGDNLLIYPWIKLLVRVNKSFIVRRGLSLRETLMSSKLMSEYMHHAIVEKNENLWIAQREGRSKDSSDLTQASVLKMMAMGGSGSLKERLTEMHICPLTISYEYDPCDWLKAREYQQRRDDDSYHKQPVDDLLNMQTGIFGYKGHIHYHCAPCIDDFIGSLPDDMPKQEFFERVAEFITHEIHSHYYLYPCNYIADDMLNGSKQHMGVNYTEEEANQFNDYLSRQIEHIELENKDEAFLRERMLTMYANPLRNSRLTTQNS